MNLPLIARLGAAAAEAWIVVGLLLFLVVGIVHVYTGRPGAARLFLIAGVLSAFQISLWLLSLLSKLGIDPEAALWG